MTSVIFFCLLIFVTKGLDYQALLVGNTSGIRQITIQFSTAVLTAENNGISLEGGFVFLQQINFV